MIFINFDTHFRIVEYYKYKYELIKFIVFRSKIKLEEQNFSLKE